MLWDANFLKAAGMLLLMLFFRGRLLNENRNRIFYWMKFFLTCLVYAGTINPEEFPKLPPIVYLLFFS